MGSQGILTSASIFNYSYNYAQIPPPNCYSTNFDKLHENNSSFGCSGHRTHLIDSPCYTYFCRLYLYKISKMSKNGFLFSPLFSIIFQIPFNFQKKNLVPKSKIVILKLFWTPESKNLYKFVIYKINRNFR